MVLKRKKVLTTGAIGIASWILFGVSHPAKAFFCDNVKLKSVPAENRDDYEKDCAIAKKFRELNNSSCYAGRRIEDTRDYAGIRLMSRDLLNKANCVQSKKESDGDKRGKNKSKKTKECEVTPIQSMLQPAPQVWEAWTNGNEMSESLANPGGRWNTIGVDTISRLHKRVITKEIIGSNNSALAKVGDDLKQHAVRIQGSEPLPPGKLRSGKFPTHTIKATKGQFEALKDDPLVKNGVIHLIERPTGAAKVKHNVEQAGRLRPSYQYAIEYTKSQNVSQQMQALIREVNQRMKQYHACESEKEKCPSESPIEFSSRIQRKYVAIHPFNDGNGRTSRMLQDLILRQLGFPPVPGGDLQNDIITPNHQYYLDTRSAFHSLYKSLESCCDTERLSESCKLTSDPSEEDCTPEPSKIAPSSKVSGLWGTLKKILGSPFYFADKATEKKKAQGPQGQYTWNKGICEQWNPETQSYKEAEKIDPCMKAKGFEHHFHLIPSCKEKWKKTKNPYNPCIVCQAYTPSGDVIDDQDDESQYYCVNKRARFVDETGKNGEPVCSVYMNDQGGNKLPEEKRYLVRQYQNLNCTQSKALYRYTSDRSFNFGGEDQSKFSAFKKARRALRNEYIWMNLKFPIGKDSVIQDLDSALDALPPYRDKTKKGKKKETATVYRGIANDPNLKVGQEVRFDRFISTTNDPSVATDFCELKADSKPDASYDGCYVYQLKTTKGKDISKLSAIPGEGEILIRRDPKTKYKVAQSKTPLDPNTHTELAKKLTKEQRNINSPNRSSSKVYYRDFKDAYDTKEKAAEALRKSIRATLPRDMQKELLEKIDKLERSKKATLAYFYRKSFFSYLKALKKAPPNKKEESKKEQLNRVFGNLNRRVYNIYVIDVQEETN